MGVFSSPKLCCLKRNPQKRIYTCPVQVVHLASSVRSFMFQSGCLTEGKKLHVYFVITHTPTHSITNNFRWQQDLWHTPSAVSYRTEWPFVWQLLPGGLNRTRQKREGKKRHLSAQKRPLFRLTDGPAATVVLTYPENNSNTGKEKQPQEDYSEAPMTTCYVVYGGAANIEIKCFKLFFHDSLDVVCAMICL